MATLTGPRATSTFPVPSISHNQGVLGVAWGYYTFAANPSAADIVQLCKLPAGATVIGGYLQAADLDTGTEALDIDLGWAANGTDAADPDGFGNFGVMDGDAVAQFRPVAGIYYPLVNIVQDSGFKTFAAETMVQAVVNAPANAGGTGTIKAVIFYVGGGVATP